MTATVARITVFPVKSCDGREQTAGNILASGAIEHDRQFALVDADGRFISAKRTARIHELRLEIDPVRRVFAVSRRNRDDAINGQLDEDAEMLSDWLSDFFSLEVSIVENSETGFPDDLDAVGPTVVSTATLQTVADWFEGISLEEVRRRFRANLEIDGVDPFWEDRLFRDDSVPQTFRMGTVVFGGTNPCQRCIVPSRDSQTGEQTPTAFSKRFATLREQMLPSWAPKQRFDHFYRLSTNTRLVHRRDGVIHVGDSVEIMGD